MARYKIAVHEVGDPSDRRYVESDATTASAAEAEVKSNCANIQVIAVFDAASMACLIRR